MPRKPDSNPEDPAEHGPDDSRDHTCGDDTGNSDASDNRDASDAAEEVDTSDADVVSYREPQSPDAIREYWTADRMKNARPIDITADPEDDV